MMKRESLFDAFDVNQKMELLIKHDFSNQAVAIIVPTFDESYRLIEAYDQPLYWEQRRDATNLLHHIASKQNKGMVHILYSGDEANETDTKFDHLILLHEFVSSEQVYIVEGLRESSENLQVSELY
jgi:hypothetical protein